MDFELVHVGRNIGALDVRSQYGLHHGEDYGSERTYSSFGFQPFTGQESLMRAGNLNADS